jgi:TM2 domain-containing membrane protein YozV
MRLILTIAICLALVQISAQSALRDSAAGRLLDLEYSLWQAQTDSSRLHLLTEKALIYRQQKNYRSAIKEIERGVTFIHDSSNVSAQWRYEALTNYFLASEFEKASLVLEYFSASQAKNIQRQKEYFYLRWSVFNEMSEWQKCKTEMISVSRSAHDTLLAERISKLPVQIRQKNPKTARVLSGIIPGTGSMYSGYPVKGATSLIINAGLIGLTAFLIVQEFYFTAFVSGFVPLLKFYTGNKRLSENLVYRRNSNTNLTFKRKYYDRIASTILLIEN